MRRTAVLYPVAIIVALLGSNGTLPAYAHAVITASSLRERPIDPGKSSNIHLSFNSAVELSLSQALLVSQGDLQQAVPLRAGKKPGKVVVELPPLDTGEYAIRYKILAADGHLTEDVIHFSVGSGKK